MLKQIQHLLTGAELSSVDIEQLIALAQALKNDRGLYRQALAGEQIALIFEKPSLRTRFSFSAAVMQMGGQVIESIVQTRKHEEPKDFIRVIQGYCTAMMIRTHDDSILTEMQAHATIPIINGLTELHHPCQILADLLTLKEHFAQLKGLSLAYIGDGNNMLHSFLILAPKVGVKVHYACPPGHEPDPAILASLPHPELVQAFASPQEAVKNCQAVYTDVWTSMGFEPANEADFEAYQVNETLMSQAAEQAVFMHCMPMERGKEVSQNLPDAPCSVIFQQSENRMHIQKAILLTLLNKELKQTEAVQK